MDKLENKFKIFLILLVLGYGALFINVNHYEFRVEESLRTIISFEMDKENSLLQPKFLGENYYNKPPLFNWFIIISSKFIPWSEFTARFVSIFFLGLTLVLIYKLSYKLFKDKIVSILSALIYLTFIDVLFWYGFLAEIDITLGFFILLLFYLEIFGFLERNKIYIILSGIVLGFAFLLKGFPAYVFYGLTFIALVLYTRRWKEFFNVFWYVSTAIGLVIPLMWIVNTASPQTYIQKLFLESIVRTEGSTNVVKLLKHFIEYPLLNIKQMLPTSIFVIVGLLLVKLKKIKLEIPKELKLLLIVIFINYIPYILAVESRGRYIIPLLTLMAIVFGYILNQLRFKLLHRTFIGFIVLLIVLRILLGVVGFDILMKYKESRKAIAKDIISTININKKIAFDCGSEKSIAVYIDFKKGEPLKLSKYIPDWDYLIDCSKNNIPDGKLLKIYKLKNGKEIKLYERVK